MTTDNKRVGPFTMDSVTVADLEVLHNALKEQKESMTEKGTWIYHPNNARMRTMIEEELQERYR